MQKRSRSVERKRFQQTCGAIVATLMMLGLCGKTQAEVPVQRTFFRLPASNGYGAIMLDLNQARLTHFREHLFATEEPLLDASGNEVWQGNQPQVVRSRDLLYDAYFGLRGNGNQQWLTSVPVDLNASGYAEWSAGALGGTGVVRMIQQVGDLEATQYFFAPQSFDHAGFVMAMRVRNTGAAPVTGVSAFSLHNFHLGFGRPGVMNDIGETGETITFDGSNGKSDFLERAFAGVVVARALGPVAHHGASNNASLPNDNVYLIVNNGGTTDLPDLNGTSAAGDGWVSAYQWDIGDIAPGQDRWVGVVFAHHGDPFAGASVQTALDGYVGIQNAQDLVTAERNGWNAFQNGIKVNASASVDETTLLRQSAVMLRMAQVREDKSYLREWLTTDGESRYTRFGTTVGGPPAILPDVVTHRGKGAILASLPPGEWTYAWIRDGAYATVAMAALGMTNEARDSLSFYLDAEGGRFQDWNELASYNMPPYQISLVRYHGFGVEETDFNDFGPNLEFDGFGLFLWVLRNYEALTGDTTLTDAHWNTVSTKVADALVALIDPGTGLLQKDSSIWESHWNGRERSYTYTSITAARGLCDAAAMATRVGDTARAATYRDAAMQLRAAIAQNLTDANGALASNLEELASGSGYWDAAVLDGIAMGLFDPQGKIAQATLAGLDANLTAPAGAGWSRNDDRYDHAGKEDLSPWGSEYDSAEWVVTDLRGSVATRRLGDVARSDRLLKWVLDQSLANYLAVAETYDESNGIYKFNAPMVGFGAGVYALAVGARDGLLADVACDAYYDESGQGGSGGQGGGGGTGGTAAAPSDDGGCGCRVVGQGGLGLGALAWLLAAITMLLRRNRVSRIVEKAE